MDTYISSLERKLRSDHSQDPGSSKEKNISHMLAGAQAYRK